MTDRSDWLSRSDEDWREINAEYIPRTREGWRQFNARYVEEFRKHNGRPPGRERDLLLFTRGARTGREHVTPLRYLRHGDGFIVCASKGGAPHHPAWYYNISAYSTAKIEVGNRAIEISAEVLSGERREQAWTKWIEAYPHAKIYAARAGRELPIMLLMPVGRDLHRAGHPRPDSATLSHIVR